MKLAGAGAIVTGGASGLGRATVEVLLAEGAQAVAFDRRPEQGASFAVREVDVTDEEQVQAGIDFALEHCGRLDIVVNCAGMGLAAPAAGPGAMDLRRFRKVLDVNVAGTFNVIRLAAPHMMANEPNEDGERGVIVNTASTVAFEGQIGTSAYAASKAAVVGMTLPLAREFAPHGIRVVTIAPGIFDTPMLNGSPPDMVEWLRLQVPFPPRTGRPPEYAALVRQIIENPMLNGETIRLDAALRVGISERWR
jgi:NAD(P)-dependent dehydrogenase (short-subunit alcohol dehydrogenase family)